MKKLIFSTDSLPRELDDQTRFKLWRDTFCDCVGTGDVSCLPDRPFAAHWEFTPIRGIVIGRFNGTMRHLARTQQQAAASRHDTYEFSFNTGAAPILSIQRGDEQVLASGEATFQTSVEATSVRTNAPSEWAGVMIARQTIRELVPAADDLVHLRLDPASPIVRHLRRYLDILSQKDESLDDSALARQIETTLVDLVALALGASGDAAAIAGMRGVRAARVQEVLAEIKSRFADPFFSSEAAARALGVSRRYVNDMLHETGRSFAERVLELRLQKARTMLASVRNDHLKVNEIALACGFNEVSYFHRCFRRRFGATPAEFRGSSEA